MTILRKLCCLALAATISIAAGAAPAQGDVESYKFDIGASLGMSGYLGDANSSNMFAQPGFAGTASFRYLAGSRFAVRAMLTAASLSGNSAKYSNVFPDNAVFDFNGMVYDLEARAEFNFFPYGIGETYKKMRRWTPYLSVGLGLTMAMCDDDTAFGPSIPMGFGFKFKLKERLNLFTEFAVIKVFNDHIDGKDLSDLATIKSSFLKNNDWYSRFTVGISYEFGKRCETCHYVD